jgi:signal peptidase
MANASAVKKPGRRSKVRVFAIVAAWVISIALVTGPSILHFTVGFGISPVLTGSMIPVAQPGDVFLTLTTNAADLKVGDIVVAEAEATGVFYAHRIIAIQSIDDLRSLTTKGDANFSADADPVVLGVNQVVARQVATLNWIGVPLAYLATVQGGQASLLIVVLANLIGLALIVFKKETPFGSLRDREKNVQDLADANAEIQSQQSELAAQKQFIRAISSQAMLDDFEQNFSRSRTSSPKLEGK